MKSIEIPEGKWIEQIPIPHHGFRYVFHPTLDHDPWKRLPTLDEPKKTRCFLEVNDSTLAPSDTDVQFLPVGIKNSLDS